ncbi:MAG: BglG family transcription antiterminator [Firmicutes bacterium]|uniref:Mannitol operon transcriptional antiterminator n=1 Tax=Melghirimyces thermohalophilus TaxID=1236220 RepID=A0A1G6NK25_9BACL|nr:BglG family transcription antiterminator [Melghirimyces thermohalophilus]MDA8352286.1 BglG family transcription antiterminator [Bacillota bacterium]SDC68332.1 mannitol operon transcriptional antiterminator [Melghirimyces thermohalophilus]
MYFTSRERALLRLLTGEVRHWTVAELAEALGVSTRTIHRDLAGLESTLDEFGLVLQKQAGRGIFLQGDAAGEESLRAVLANTPERDYTPVEREVYLLCTLLDASEPVKLAALAADLGVTPATIRHDLDRVQVWLQSFDLTLLIQRGWGVQVLGGEKERRSAMRSLLADHFDEGEILGIMKRSLTRQSPELSGAITERLLGLMERERLIQVERVVQEEIKNLPYSLADAAYVGLVVHLALAIERIQQGEMLSFDPSMIEDRAGTEEQKVAERIAERLSKHLGLTFPEAEVANILLHLRGAKLGTDQGYWFREGAGTVVEETGELIRRVGEELGVSLAEDPSLTEGLLAHLERAVYRLRENLPIHNPLLPRIEKEYPVLFDAVEKAMAEVFPSKSVPREEIGYLVMHFGAALERRRRGRPRRALVVCASGIGTSKLLASRLQAEFPQIAGVETASFLEWPGKDPRDYDLILSTIPLDLEEGAYLRVHPYLTDQDLSRIRARLKETGPSMLNRDMPPATEASDADVIMDTLEGLRQAVDGILMILRGFSYREISEGATLSEVLYQACRRLEAEGVLREPAAVTDRLLQRQQLGGLGIPGTGLALFHARSDEILRPSFTAYDLAQPIELKGMDGEKMKMTGLLMLLAPETGMESLVGSLSRISALIVEAPTVFQSKDESGIRGFLAEQLNRSLFEKIEEQRRV